ncbi:hypothetical protein Tco_1271114, partial [Tanacetum coccineum]
ITGSYKPVVVHDSEETLEIAELTRKRVYEKMKSPQYLTPEQIFWAKDENDRKKVEASVLKPQNENQKDVNDEMIRGFNKLEVEYLNLQLNPWDYDRKVLATGKNHFKYQSPWDYDRKVPRAQQGMWCVIKKGVRGLRPGFESCSPG